MATRISKKVLRQLPTELAAEITRLAAEYHIASFTHATCPANMVLNGQPAYGLYLSEGSRYSILYHGEVTSAEVVSQDCLGATGVTYDVGKTAPIPVNATIIEIYYYTRFFMRITVVTPPALA